MVQNDQALLIRLKENEVDFVIGDYSKVFGKSVLAKLTFGEFRFLDLDALIQAKTAANRDRYKRALAHLHAIKERTQKGASQQKKL